MTDPTIQAAADALRRGELVAFPTETVYGLGAHARNPTAVRKIFTLKGRPHGHPLIVHLPDAQPLADWARATPLAERLAERFWPGPLTLILTALPDVPAEVTVGRALLTALGDGVAAPSANRFGAISPTTAAHVRSELGAELRILDGGPCAVGIESTIIDLSGPAPALLRPGGIPAAEIEELTGRLSRTSTTAAPGTLKSHYSPRTTLHLSRNLRSDTADLLAAGQRVGVLTAQNPRRYAKDLYADLRNLDDEGWDVILVEMSPPDGVGEAINDRLVRAAHSEKWG